MAEDAQRFSDQRLRAAVESSPSGLLMIDMAGRIVLVNREVERLFGYPREVLRPTDFHTATLVGEGIYIVGCLGYFGTQPLGTTPVLRLDTTTFAIEPVATTGRNPGWMYQHDTAYVPERHALRMMNR